MVRSLNEIIPTNTAWIPDPGVSNHAGGAILENSDFFVRPPIEIGRVISAETTLTGNKKAIATSERIKMMGVGFVAMLVFFILWKTINNQQLGWD